MTRNFKDESKNLPDWWSERANRHDIKLDELDRRTIAGIWIDPVYVNGWGNAGGTYEDFAYRLFASDTLQVKGTMTGGTSGSIAFTLYVPWRPLKDISIVGAVVVAGNFMPARLDIEASTGDVSVHF